MLRQKFPKFVWACMETFGAYAAESPKASRRRRGNSQGNPLAVSAQQAREIARIPFYFGPQVPKCLSAPQARKNFEDSLRTLELQVRECLSAPQARKIFEVYQFYFGTVRSQNVSPRRRAREIFEDFLFTLGPHRSQKVPKCAAGAKDFVYQWPGKLMKMLHFLGG